MHLSTALAIGAVLRIGLLAYSDWHDRHLDVPFTDIDYQVFTDAAGFVAHGESPYNRATYRYTPLLAYLLLGNVWWHPAWGKVIFSVADLLVAWGLHKLAMLSGCDAGIATNACLAWLLNPFTFTISTRGSSDALVAFVLLAVLLMLRWRLSCLAGILWGFAVHWRMFPVIYGPSIMLFLALSNANKENASSSKVSPGQKIIRNIFCFDCIKFGIASTATFFGLGLIFYQAYGYQFLNDAYLHHLGRRDPRHNFSVYFYPIYLHDYQLEEVGSGMGTAFDMAKWALIPPAMLILLASWRLSDHLPFSWLVITMIFVAFNKVCTAQYFVWYFCFLPLVALDMPWPPQRHLLASFILWVATLLNWLGWAYMLEFQGAAVFPFVWVSSCIFLMSNGVLIWRMSKDFSPRISFLDATTKRRD